MPVYEYKCLKCNHEFEELIRRSDDELNLKCPSCGLNEIERLLSLFGFKGNFGGSLDSVSGSSGSSCSSCSSKNCSTCR